MKFTYYLVAAAALSFASLQALAAQDLGAHQAAALAKVDGEVRKVDKEQGKVTLRHGPIPNLEMPGMTMVFKVADNKLLETVKEGDKVKFTADKVSGAYVITSMEAAK